MHFCYISITLFKLYVNNRIYEISYISKDVYVPYTEVEGGGFPVISYAPFFKTIKEKGITSYRLGKMGFPLSNYYAMKRGENISTHTLNQLCKLLQCKVEEIIEYEDEE